MKPVRFLFFSTLTLLFGATSVVAQALDCTAIFRAALAAASENCAFLERNQACLAYGSVMLTLNEGDAASLQPGDRVDASTISTLAQTAESGWALTIMQLQFNQPDSAPEYNSVLMVLGNVSLDQHLVEMQFAEADEEIPGMYAQINAGLGDDGRPSPLQSLSFASTSGSPCDDALPNGIVIQSPNLTPADVAYLPTQVQINDWRFALGSTVFVAVEQTGEMIAEVFEHFATVSAEDGSILVVAGEGIELPADTPSVSNEDGTVVIVPRPTPEESLFSGIWDVLFGEEEIVNRTPSNSPGSGRVESITPAGQIVRDGIWKYEVYDDYSFGDCIMNIWNEQLIVDYIMLDEVLDVSADGRPTMMRFFDTDYQLDPHEDDSGGYEARKWALGNMIYEQITLYTMPYYIYGRFIGIIRDEYAARNCIHIVHYSISSCLMDVFYDDTAGDGDCPAEIHTVMGTR